MSDFKYQKIINLYEFDEIFIYESFYQGFKGETFSILKANTSYDFDIFSKSVNNSLLFKKNKDDQPYKISVNIFPETLYRFFEEIKITIEKNEHIMIELILKNLNKKIDQTTLLLFKDRLILDDFEPNDTKHLELLELNPFAIKIDVQNKINYDLEMMTNINKKTIPIAKKIETKEELEKCLKIGFNYGQGYFFEY